MPLPLIAQDKANHALYGAAIAAASASLCIAVFMPQQLKPALPLLWASTLGLSLSALAGYVKEKRDEEANAERLADGLPPVHSVERADMLATLAGGALVAVPMGVAGLLAWGV